MVRNKKYLFFILILLLAGGCQEQGPNKSLFPTPFQNTLDAGKSYPGAIVTQIPTAMISTLQTKETSTNNPSPKKTKTTTTQIFPQATQPNYPKHPELAENIDQIITQAGGRWHIVLKEVGGPTYYSLLTEQRINIASVVKVPIALLFFEALEEKGIAEHQLAEHLQSTGTGGRTFEQLLRAMLVKSEEDATDILFEYIGDYVNSPVQLREWQLEGIDLDARRYTADGIASLFERLYQGEFVSPTARILILGYLSEYTPNDDTRIGTLTSVIPESFRIYNKRGSLLTPYVVADSAILENPDGTDYIITIFAYNSEPKTTYEILDQAVGEISLAFWDYVSTEKD